MAAAAFVVLSSTVSERFPVHVDHSGEFGRNGRLVAISVD
jgi:hypothetical protein